MRRLNRKKDEPKKEEDMRSKVDKALLNMIKMFQKKAEAEKAA